MSALPFRSTVRLEEHAVLEAEDAVKAVRRLICPLHEDPNHNAVAAYAACEQIDLAISMLVAARLHLTRMTTPHNEGGRA